MSMTMTPFMTKIANELKEKNLSDSTITQYLQTLFKLNDSKPFRNLVWTKSTDVLDDRISKYAPSTQITQYTILTSVMSPLAEKSGYKRPYNYYRSKMLENKKSFDEENGENKKTEKQEDAWIDWEDVLKTKHKFEEDVAPLKKLKHLNQVQYELLLNYLILSLYTDIPPRRNQDYLCMVVVKKLPKEQDENKNYYDLSTNKFYFNKFKTAKVKGQKTQDIPESLEEALNLYLKFHPSNKLKSKEYNLLVKFDGSPLTTVNAITRILNKIFGKRVGSSMLRHSFLSSKYGDTLQDMKQTAEEMGHSVNEATKTYIKFDNQTEESEKSDKKTK